jgi:hypothetical protein
MARRPPSAIHLPAQGTAVAPPRTQFGTILKAFLTAVMGLLSVLVFGLGLEHESVLWLWMGFICALVSGIFVQILLNRRKKENAEDSPDQ